MDSHYDIVVVGAGLVGSSLIAALSNSQLRIAVLENHLPSQERPDLDARPLSLAYASKKVLETLGVWKQIEAFSTPINEVHVSEQNHLGILHFRASEENIPALGYVVPHDLLHHLLYQHMAQNQNVKFINFQAITQIKNHSVKTEISIDTIEGSKELSAELLIAADGANSPVRKLLAINATEDNHSDLALIIKVNHRQPHQNIAYERFTEQGIIALLPLKNALTSKIVWSLSKDFAATVANWSNQQLSEYLTAAMNNRLGTFEVVERAKAIPLMAIISQEQIRPGVVLLGNAAHALYPTAAQGFNLGLRDAAYLAEILLDARKDNIPLGDYQLLQSYLARRIDDQRWIQGITGRVGQLFELKIPGLSILRGMGMLAADLVPPIKSRLAKRLMGLSGESSKLVRGIPL